MEDNSKTEQNTIGVTTTLIVAAAVKKRSEGKTRRTVGERKSWKSKNFLIAMPRVVATLM